MSVSEDRTVQPATTPTIVSGIADPAPLGLAAFALTTFLLSANNAGWMTHASGAAFLSYAFAYGGLAQLLAGMWEFRNRNVYGALLFGSFGAFWIGLALWFRFQAVPALTAAAAHPVTLPATVAVVNHDLGWILLAWAIFTTYMMIMAAQVNTATFTALFLLWATLIILAIGNFNLGSAATSTTIKIGGYVGLATALNAWYNSAAGLAKGMGGKLGFPLGRPLIK